MRISDWISDVCSSDLFLATGYGNGGEEAWKTFLSGNYHHPGDDMSQKIDWQAGARFAEANYRIARAMADSDTPPLWYKGDYFGNLFARSEEHTSELQSLMRISYAVFCLKKKKPKNLKNNSTYSI